MTKERNIQRQKIAAGLARSIRLAATEGLTSLHPANRGHVLDQLNNGAAKLHLHATVDQGAMRIEVTAVASNGVAFTLCNIAEGGKG